MVGTLESAGHRVRPVANRELAIDRGPEVRYHLSHRIKKFEYLNSSSFFLLCTKVNFEDRENLADANSARFTCQVVIILNAIGVVTGDY